MDGQLGGNRDKVKTWIREQSVLFLSTYFNPTDPEIGGDCTGSSFSPCVQGELTRPVRRLEEDCQLDTNDSNEPENVDYPDRTENRSSDDSDDVHGSD